MNKDPTFLLEEEPRLHQAVLLLHYRDGMGFQEIADYVHVSREEVKRIIVRFLVKARQRWTAPKRLFKPRWLYQMLLPVLARELAQWVIDREIRVQRQRVQRGTTKGPVKQHRLHRFSSRTAGGHGNRVRRG